MTDRELLELAAKAGGIAGEYRAGLGICPPELSQLHKFWWNPLTDDGDALRLATAIGMDSIEFVIDEWPDHAAGMMRKKPNIPATRRAIVRAAAEIGKGMK